MTVRTTRLVLRELCAADAPALNKIECDPRVTRFMSFDPQSPRQTCDYLERTVREQSESPRRTYDMAIVLRTDAPISEGAGVLVGRCGMGIRRPEHREAELWYLLHPAHRGRGYALEATGALVDFAFGALKLHRVWADCDPRNLAACRVATSLGMRLEGTLRENYWLKGEWCSSNVHGLLEGEWAFRKPGSTPAQKLT